MSRGSDRGVFRRRLALTAIGLVAVAAASTASAASAYVPTGDDFRISNVFDAGGPSRVGTDSAIAYNSAADEYLVVYRADAGADEDFEIFGRRVNAAGVPQGPDFPISDVTGADRTAQLPAVAYNAVAGNYLVVWSGDGLAANDEFEIFGRLVSAAGVPAAGPDVRLSVVGVDGDSSDAEAPAIAHDPAQNRYLVSWQADGHTDPPTDDRIEIFGRLVNAAGGPEGGDFRLSEGGPDSDPDFDATRPAVAFNPAGGEYLVVWQGEALATEGVTEVYGQRVSNAGVPHPQGDLRISDQGSDTDATRDGGRPAVAYNSSANAYLVVWRDDGWNGAGDDEFEIFGQRLSAAGADQGGDLRLSTVGNDGDASRMADDPAVAFSGAGNEYMVGWEADGLATGGELEVFGQRVNATGGQIGGDTRISSAGPDNDPAFDAEDPAIAFASTANQYLAVWTADDAGTDDADEIFGRRLAPAPAAATPAPTPVTRAYELPKAKKKCKKKKKKKGKSAASSAKKKKKKKC